MIQDSANRVPQSTDEDINQRIREMTERNIALYRSGDPVLIQQRLEELDREWDIERVLETNAAALTLTGLVMAARRGRFWLMVPTVVGFFLLQHGLKGWCPPVPFFRKMGFRTRKEIDAERYALKVLRGDFQNLPIEPEKSHMNMDLLFTAIKR